MKNKLLKATLITFGAILFNLIFWNEKLGINTAIFMIFISATTFYLYPSSIKNENCRWLFTAQLIATAMVIFHNTLVSKIALTTSMLLFVSFSQYLHRSILYAGSSVVLNCVWAIPNLLREAKYVTAKKIKFSVLAKSIRIILLPLLILTVFVIIYAFANSIFSAIATIIATAIENFFANFFELLPVQRFEFFAFGIFISSGLILAVKYNPFAIADMKKRDVLLRRKNNFKIWTESAFADLFSVLTGRHSTGTLVLKTEYTIGFISLVLLNVLLFFINIIDIKYSWLGFTFSSGKNMASYVHEGAGLLILSIVLAIILLLFFFRGNLNFYKKSNLLKYGAYLWIFQNFILVLSVFIRDYYYISHYGLAYKRIGLLFFLAMVLAGLITVFLKIRFIKTTYYLLRINAWAGIFLLVFASTINWDVTIAAYNLRRKSLVPVDVHFLLSLSDATLPLIEKNKEVLENHSEGRSTALQFLEYRQQTFKAEQNSYSWLSWNMADAGVLKELKTLPAISSLH